MGSKGWGVKGVKFRVRGSVGDRFRVRGSVGNRVRVSGSITDGFSPSSGEWVVKSWPLVERSGQYF